MVEHNLRFKSRISRRQSKEMLLLFAKHGNHHHDFEYRIKTGRPLVVTDADVIRLLKANNVDFNRQVEKCRDFSQTAPFENLIKSTFAVMPGTKVSRVHMPTGEEDLEVVGPATFTMHTYWALFEDAIEARDRAAAKQSYAALLTAITEGIASIEAYINYLAEEWNRTHPQDLLADSTQEKVSFDKKVDDWLPKIARGKKLDKSGRRLFKWEHFKKFRALRDDANVHAKSSGYGIPLEDMVNLINTFRSGIAAFLIELHLMFNDKIPAIIIRAAYTPDVEIIEVESQQASS